MDSFMDICIQDGKLTAAGERASALVYERITGGCWHRKSSECVRVWGDGGNYPYHVRLDKCPKCGAIFMPGNRKRNPPLTTSLDSWMPLWKAMGDELMAELFGMRVTNRHLLDPMWWLEASLRACGLYEKWKKEAE